MRLAKLLAVLLISVPGLDAATASPVDHGSLIAKADPRNAVIRGEIKKLVALMSDGVAEEPGDPVITYIPDGLPSAGAAVALFYIEGWNGGNSSSAFLAVFERTDTEGWSPDWKPQPYHLAAFTAARGSLPLEIDGRKLSVGKDGVITIVGMTWGPDDAHCCPKKPVTVRFRYEAFELKEIN